MMISELVFVQMYIEFCAGGAVDNIMLDLEKALTENQIRSITGQMMDALEFIHSKNVIHRDLKAGNVLLTMDGEVRLGEGKPDPGCLVKCFVN